MKSTIIPLNQAGLASFRFPWYGRLKYEVNFFGFKRNPFVSKGAPTVDGWNPVNSAVEVGSWNQNNTGFQKHPRWGRISSIFGTAKQIWNLNSSSDCWLDLVSRSCWNVGFPCPKTSLFTARCELRWLNPIPFGGSTVNPRRRKRPKVRRPRRPRFRALCGLCLRLASETHRLENLGDGLPMDSSGLTTSRVLNIWEESERTWVG